MNSDGTGVSHNVSESYTRLPQAHIISANRVNENQMKITKRVDPSQLLEINGVTYYLKAVVKHSGTIAQGHYVTAFNMEQLWVICDDSFDFKITDLTPIDGYLFFYENVCLKLSNDLLNRLSTFFQEQRNSHFQYLTSQSENFEIPRSFAKRNINSKQLAKTTSQIDRDPNDQSIVLELSRCETIEMLKSLNISFNNDRSTARLKEILVNLIR